MKRHRQSLKGRARNRYNAATMRTELKHARQALASDSGDAAEAVKKAVTRLDKITTKGAIPKKKASRLKSRLMKQLAAK